MKQETESKNKKHLQLDNDLKEAKRANERLESEVETLKMSQNSKVHELIEKEQDIETKRRELQAKEVALNQNADIQKISQQFMRNKQEMKDKMMTDMKRSNSVLDYMGKDAEQGEMYMNHSVANFGWEDPKNYLIMNEKFKGLVELLKNKLENLQKEKDRIELKNVKYKSNNSELKEKLDNVKNEVHLMETTNNLKEDRIAKLKEELRDLKENNKTMALEIEENLSKRPVSSRWKAIGEPSISDIRRNSNLATAKTSNDFREREEQDRNLMAQINQLEREAHVLKEMMSKRDTKIDTLKNHIKNNDIAFEKTKLDYNDKMLENEALMEKIHNFASTNQSYYKMITDINESNNFLTEKINLEIRKRKKIVKAHNAEVEELKVRIQSVGKYFSQIEAIKKHLKITQVLVTENGEMENEEMDDDEYYHDEEEEEEEEEDEEEDDEEEEYEQTQVKKSKRRFKREEEEEDEDEEDDEEDYEDDEEEEDEDEDDEEIQQKFSKNNRR